MGAADSYGTLARKQFTATKLLFNSLFWAFHWGLFAYGW